MNIFGLQITRKAIQSVNATGQLASVDNRGWFRIFESFAGAWQRNVSITLDNVTTHPAVFACTTLIANDISKMRMRLVQQDDDGIWNEVEVPAFSPVLRKPNHYQNRIQFYSSWIMSKELNGNAYAIKARDARRVVVAKYILDPQRVRPLVAPNGDVFYELKRDDLSLLPQEQYVVPASEIIHDRHNTLFHPLVGLSSIYACGLAAVQGLNIQNSSTLFFGNGSTPGGVITAPGALSEEAAARIKTAWETGFSGDNTGKVAVLAGGLTYTQMKVSAVDSQLIEQLKWTDEMVCACFHVPPYMVGLGAPPAYNNIEALNRQYYSQCLQVLIESIELCLDEGLGLTDGENFAKRYGTEFDLDDLLRMDSATMMRTLKDGAGIMAPNEARSKLNLKPVRGGEAPYLQQQNWPLQILSQRAVPTDIPGLGKPTPKPPAELPPANETAKVLEFQTALQRKALQIAHVNAGVPKAANG